MTTPQKLITQKSDPWHVKTKKWLCRWLWNDLTKLPKPAKGYPNQEKPKYLALGDCLKRGLKDWQEGNVTFYENSEEFLAALEEESGDQ
jgi:hypothetical protein